MNISYKPFILFLQKEKKSFNKKKLDIKKF